MRNDNPYSVLGLRHTATDAQVKRAYRALAFQCHPDRHPGDKYAEEKFKAISAAHAQILKEREGRAKDFHTATRDESKDDNEFRFNDGRNKAREFNYAARTRRHADLNRPSGHVAEDEDAAGQSKASRLGKPSRR